MKKTIMSEKFASMLLGGTLTRVVIIFTMIADSVIAGNLLGEDALAGISLIAPLQTIVLFLIMSYSIGARILYGRKMGGFQKTEADQVFGYGLLASVFAGGVSFLLVFAFGDAYLSFFRASEAVFTYAKEYLFWIGFVFLLLPLQSFLSDMVYADGDEFLSTASDVFQAVFNIPLSFLFCRHMGAAGLSLGTFITTFLALVIPLLHFLKKTNSLRPNLYFSPALSVSALRYSIIDASSYLLTTVYGIVLEVFIAHMYGADKLVVASVILTLTELMIIFDGVGEAIGPLMNMYTGEGSVQGIRQLYRLARRASLAEGIIATVLALVFAPVIPMALGISSPEVLLLSTDAVRIISLGFIFTSFAYLISSYYLLREKILLGLVISILQEALLPLLLGMGFGSLFGIYGLFAGLAMAQFLTLVIVMLYILLRYDRADWFLLLARLEKENNSILFDFTLSPEEIIRICDEIEEALCSRNYAKKMIMKTRLIVEEVFMFVYELNKEKTVLAECLLTMKPDHIEIMEMDDGQAFDLTDEDMDISTLRAYVITNVASKWTPQKTWLPTLSENRNMFRIENGTGS